MTTGWNRAKALTDAAIVLARGRPILDDELLVEINADAVVGIGNDPIAPFPLDPQTPPSTGSSNSRPGRRGPSSLLAQQVHAIDGAGSTGVPLSSRPRRPLRELDPKRHGVPSTSSAAVPPGCRALQRHGRLLHCVDQAHRMKRGRRTRYPNHRTPPGQHGPITAVRRILLTSSGSKGPVFSRARCSLGLPERGLRCRVVKGTSSRFADDRGSGRDDGEQGILPCRRCRRARPVLWEIRRVMFCCVICRPRASRDRAPLGPPLRRRGPHPSPT